MIKWRASRMSHGRMATSLARPVRHPAKFLCGNPARPTAIRRRGGMPPAEASTLARPMAGPFQLPGAAPGRRPGPHRTTALPRQPAQQPCDPLPALSAA
jgi:hypothetical protein